MPLSRPPRGAQPKRERLSLALDPAHRRALSELCRLTGRTPQSLLREGLDHVLLRYVPVDIKALPQPGGVPVAKERRAVKRVPTLTDSIDSAASWAARAVRAAYVAATLAPNDPRAKALTQAAVTAAKRHGFVVNEKRPKR
jgi:hypothetical protein